MQKSKDLLAVIRKLEIRLEQLEGSTDAIECKAEGMLEAALAAVESAANLLGEDVPEIVPAPKAHVCQGHCGALHCDCDKCGG